MLSMVSCALPLAFQFKLGLVRGKYLPADLHDVEAPYVSASSLSSLRAAIVMRKLNAVSSVVTMGMVISFGTALFPPLSMFGNFLSSCPSWCVIAVRGAGACFGMVGCLVSVLLVSETPGLPLWVSWLTGCLSG